MGILLVLRDLNSYTYEVIMEPLPPLNTNSKKQEHLSGPQMSDSETCKIAKKFSKKWFSDFFASFTASGPLSRHAVHVSDGIAPVSEDHSGIQNKLASMLEKFQAFCLAYLKAGKKKEYTDSVCGDSSKSISLDSAFASSADKLYFSEQSKSEKKQRPEIYHLDGTTTVSYNSANAYVKLSEKYYFERIPLHTKSGEVFIYGNTLKVHVKKWISKLKSGETEKNFQEYMQDEMANNKRLEEDLMKKSVRFFTDDERQQVKTEITNGKLQQIGLDSKSGELKPLEAGNYAFIISEIQDQKTQQMHQELFCTLKLKTAKGNIQHSSFVRGGNVISAGLFEINRDGRIISINNTSGHYQPKARELAIIMNFLKTAGYDILLFHVTYYKSYRILPGLKLGVIHQRGDLWLEQRGKKFL